jgi:hypothetical protein
VTPCDDSAAWVTDSNYYNAVQIDEEPVVLKEGAGSIRITVPKNPTIREHTVSAGAAIPLGNASDGRKVICIRFKTATTTKDLKARILSFFCYVTGSPANPLTAHIYSDSSGSLGSSLASANVSGVSISANWRDATLGADLTLTSNTYYWVLIITTQNSDTDYYQIITDAYALFDEGVTMDGPSTGSLTERDYDLDFKVKASTDALNKYAYDVFGAVNLSSYPNLKAWIRASRTGNQFSLMGESAMRADFGNYYKYGEHMGRQDWDIRSRNRRMPSHE